MTQIKHTQTRSLTPGWKRLKGKNPEGKNFRKLLRRKQSSAKISKISGNTLKSSKSDIFYLLRNLLKYLLRTFFSSAKFSEVFALCVFTLWLFPYRFLTSFLPRFNLRSASNLEPRFGNHGLQTLGFSNFSRLPAGFTMTHQKPAQCFLVQLRVLATS